MKDYALILYGRGDELGKFSVFANSLKAELSAKGTTVEARSVERKDAFFSTILGATKPIAQLHVFAHSMGGGLFLGYHDQAVSRHRQQVFGRASSAGRRVTYDEVVDNEIGALLTDDLVRGRYSSMGPSLSSKLSPKATVKLWGCNSAIRGWVYSDEGIVDPADTRVDYYWRALNEKNSPKPSIAQALATYLQRTVYGASSGSHIEVRYSGRWMTSSAYKQTLGRWPSGSMTHRLHPDAGNYAPYTP